MNKNIYQKKYSKTPTFKINLKKFMQTQKWKDYKKKYEQTPLGKISVKRTLAKRRKLGFIPIINNPFPKEVKINHHHINNTFVIPIPKKLHRSSLGKQHRIKVNKKIENLGFDLGSFMNKNEQNKF